MDVSGRQFYVLGQDALAKMSQERIRLLEATLLGEMMEYAEVDAYSKTLKVEEVVFKDCQNRITELEQSMDQVMVRIDAVREFCNGEFEQPKGDA